MELKPPDLTGNNVHQGCLHIQQQNPSKKYSPQEIHSQVYQRHQDLEKNMLNELMHMA